jgi:predicted phage tail protein
MTADSTEVGLAELLHLPHVQVRAEQVGPGRQGGPLLVVIGISLIGLALWGWATDALGWSVFALTALGAALALTGVGLMAHTQLDQQPTDSTLSSPLAARMLALCARERA